MLPVHDATGRSRSVAADISVVVPAYNGERTIADCLQSIDVATRGRRREIIVVDSSTDTTAEIIARAFPDVTVIRSPDRLSAGQARNVGGAAARGRLVFFTDQDCVVPADWIERIEAHFRDPDVHGVGGAVGIRNFSSASGCALYFLEFLNHFPSNAAPKRDEKFLVGCNSAYRADVISTTSFPDQTLGEDILFAHQMWNRGLHIMYDPSIAVLHQNREGWREFFSYNRKMGEAAASYHSILNLWWAAPTLRFPLLVLSAPLAVLPSIARALRRSDRSYLLRFLTLLPMCLVGNLIWANAFRLRVQAMRATKAAAGSTEAIPHSGCASPPHESQGSPH